MEAANDGAKDRGDGYRGGLQWPETWTRTPPDSLVPCETLASGGRCLAGLILIQFSKILDLYRHTLVPARRTECPSNISTCAITRSYVTSCLSGVMLHPHVAFFSNAPLNPIECISFGTFWPRGPGISPRDGSMVSQMEGRGHTPAGSAHIPVVEAVAGCSTCCHGLPCVCTVNATPFPWLVYWRNSINAERMSVVNTCRVT